MAEITNVVTASVRRQTGKEAARKLRRSGQVPCIVYGCNQDPVVLQADTSVLMDVVHDPSLISLKIDGQQDKAVLIREVQRNYIRDDLLHVDFLEVRLDEKIVALVPVDPFGIPIGTQQAGVLEQLMHEIEVECLPMDLPAKIVCDVSTLALDDQFTMEMLPLPDKVVATAEPQVVVFQVQLPRIAEEPEEEKEAEEVLGEAADDEPKVISKGKKEEGEEGDAGE